MITIISPAKSLDYTVAVPKTEATIPHFLKNSEKLVGVLKKKKPADLKKMMDISADLAALNYQRYQHWKADSIRMEGKPAVLVFNGDVYRGLEVNKFTVRQLEYAQEHLFILSGLYGVLRSLDLILPYRLEMGTSLKIDSKTKNLYEFWGEKITDFLNRQANGEALINLASNEYFKSVKPKLYQGDIITPVFKEFKNGKYSVVMTYAKQARGKMARFIIEKKINNPEKLKLFNTDRYMYTESLSSENEWVFTR